MTDIKSHIEAIRSIFKKRFSGEFSYLNGSKSPDIFRGKDDLEENFEWKNYGDELDKFDDEIYGYIDEKKLNGHTVEEILKNFESTGKNFDKKIAWEPEPDSIGTYVGMDLYNHNIKKSKKEYIKAILVPIN